MSPWAVHFVGIVMAVAIIWALWRARKIPRPAVRIPLQITVFFLGWGMLEWYIAHVRNAGIPKPGGVGWTVIGIGAIVVYFAMEWSIMIRNDASKTKKE